MLHKLKSGFGLNNRQYKLFICITVLILFDSALSSAGTSNGFQSTATKRMVKKGGSIKINGICPSRIIAHCKNNGQVEVHFIETHVGHTSSFRNQRLTNAQKEELVAKLKAGIPKRRIIEDARKMEGKELQRINFLNYQDLANLSARFNVENRRNLDDMIAVSIKVEEWNSGGKNYAFLYKKIGDFHPKLQQNDFALGFMNKSMEAKLKNYSKIICMDGTHGTNNKKFELTIMMVKDNQDMGFPVAFLISNRQDQFIQEVFLQEFKVRVGEEIKPDYLMSDDDPKYYNAWTTVMGSTPRRLLCAWHVRKNWVIQGKRKIKNEEIRRQMSTDLGNIMTATNEESFWKLKMDYFKKLEDGNEEDFINYLQRQYFVNDTRIKMWAYCHRLNAGINTNMALESFNKFLKDSLDRNSQSTLEKLLDKIDEAVENKMWTTISNVERPSSNNHKDREISKAHKRAEARNLNEDIEVMEFGKFKVKSSKVVVEEPEFTDVIENITVAAGRNVKFACSVKNLGTYKVAWMHFEQSAILTVHNHVITRNPRISVTHDKHRTWFLHISNVQEEDKGRYMCQINTVTAKTQFGYLHVVVPPNIDDSISSSDVIVREGANETLTCRATGSPQPSVKWKRDDNSKIAINKTRTVTEWDGETLELIRISRLDMGAYLCIASNGVPPTVSKRIKVSVDFPPMLWIPHQLVGAPLAYSVTLECFTEAHPSSLNYWTREDGHMIHESKKYHTENLIGVPSYKTHMRLTISNIHQSDYGTYKCVAKNPRGETDGTIRLYTSSPPTTAPKPTTTETPSRMRDVWGNGDFNNSVYGNPSSLTVHLSDKGSKYQSNLNDIDKSEQKSGSDIDSKGAIYEWPSSDESSLGCSKYRVSSWSYLIFLYLLLR